MYILFKFNFTIIDLMTKLENLQKENKIDNKELDLINFKIMVLISKKEKLNLTIWKKDFEIENLRHDQAYQEIHNLWKLG